MLDVFFIIPKEIQFKMILASFTFEIVQRSPWPIPKIDKDSGDVKIKREQNEF